MSSEMKLEVLCRKCIKPSSPTPPHLQEFKLSLLDQLSPDIHGNMTFFYPYKHEHDPPLPDFSAKSQLLQNSLSQMLSRFYPLAGRLHDAATIDCNDQGAFFIETRTGTSLSDILSNPDFDTLQHLLPTTDNETMQISNGNSNSMLLLVRFTLFGCGGTAISISLVHKIADIAAFITLLQSWTALCRGDTQPVVPELAIGATLFPPREILGMSSSINIAAEKFTARRFVFEAPKVEDLKSRVTSALEGGFYPSRVEVVLALIWRCAMLASSSKTVSFRPSVLFQAVNLRPRMDPVVPDTAIGNFVWPFAVTVEEESEMELHELVKKLRKAMREFLETKANQLKEEGGFGAVVEGLKERMELLKKNKDHTVVYKCSSWCKFPLLEADFGWGKPVWAVSVNRMVSNTIALMDTREGGVEAFVTLDEQEMRVFEQHQEMLHYALPNPSVII